MEDMFEKVAMGGRILANIATARLRDALDAVEAGDFDAAYDRTTEAMAKLGPLVQAQNTIAVMAEGNVVRARDVSEGMTLAGMGVVTAKETEECPGRDHGHVKLSFEGERVLTLSDAAEVFVMADDEDGASP